MKKLLITLNVDGKYAPEVVRLTQPFQAQYAKKIGAEYHIITERKFEHTGLPLNVEKFQLHKIAPEFDYTLFVDADAWISPDAPDFFEMFNDKSVVFFNGIDNRLDRFAASQYSRRSNARVGACTWFVGCSDWTAADLWAPPDDWAALINTIQTLWCEAKTGQCKREHLIDDCQLSDNIARYGLKVKTINGLCEEMGRQNLWLTHLYNCPEHAKSIEIRRRLDDMGISYPV